MPFVNKSRNKRSWELDETTTKPEIPGVFQLLCISKTEREFENGERKKRKEIERERESETERKEGSKKERRKKERRRTGAGEDKPVRGGSVSCLSRSFFLSFGFSLRWVVKVG